MNNRHQEFDFSVKVLNKTIDVKSKAVLWSVISIREIDAHYWKDWRNNKKTSRFQKVEKIKLAYNQPITSAGTN